MATNGIKEIKVSNTNYLIEPTLYTTIKQTSAAATFTADLANFELFTGVTVAVKFGVTNNGSATLNINGTGAKAIYYEGAAIAASKLKAKHTYVFTYNGTQWELIGDLDTDTNTHRPIQVNGTEVLGNNTTALNLKNGDNVSITNNSGTVTIAATDTTYTFENGTNGFKVTPLGGTAQTVTVTPSIANNITGSGTVNYLTKFTAASTIGATGIAIDSNNNLTIPSTLIKFTGLGEGLELSQSASYFGTNYDARIISIIDSNPGTGSTAVDGGLIIQAVGRVSNTDTIQELLRIRNHNGSADWKTGEFQWKTKDVVVEVGKANKTWDISIAGDAATVNGHTVEKNVPSNAVFTDTKSFTITANATDGYWDLTGTSGTNAVTYALAPYSSKQSGASFYTGTANPDGTTRLNYNGYLYATKLYSGDNEVLTIQTKAKGLSSIGWYRILDCTAHSMAFFITFYGSYNNQPPTPVTFLVSHAYNTTKIEQIGRSANIGWIQQLRAVHHDTSKFYIDVYYAGDKGNIGAFEITPLDPNARSNITLIDFTAITGTVTANASCSTSLESHADKAEDANTVGGLTVKTAVPANAKFTDTTYSSGTGLSLSGTTFNHSNSVTAKTAYPTGTTASANGGTFTIRDVQYDEQGHITGSQDRTITLSQTTYSLSGLGGIGTISASGTAPLTLSGSKSGTTYTLTGSIADASASASGIVNTDTQVFSGVKSFNNGIHVYGAISTQGTGSTAGTMYPGGAYHSAHNSIVLHGDSAGVSGIGFTSEKATASGTTTNINSSSDRAFIQYHAYGVTAAAEGTAPTLATSGELGTLVIGVGNDATDTIRLQAPGATGILHQIGATAYPIPHTTNTNGSVGGTTTPVYVDGGVIKAGTALKALAYEDSLTYSDVGAAPAVTGGYLPLSGGTMTGDIKGNAAVALGTVANPFHNIVLGGTTTTTMTADSTNPRITFQESNNGTQQVHLIYGDADSYRAPAGLKIIGEATSGDLASPAWLEVEGDIIGGRNLTVSGTGTFSTASPSLIIKATGSNAVTLALERNNLSSWKWMNSGGSLALYNNWTTSSTATEYFPVITYYYSTGNITINKGDLTLKNNPTSDMHAATKAYVDSILAANNAMTFKGTIDSINGSDAADSTNRKTLPATHNAGDTYRVAKEGTYAGKYCEIGTLIICTTDGTAANDAHWTSVETNEDGAVIGPTSSTENSLAFFSSTSGRVLDDTGTYIKYLNHVAANAGTNKAGYIDGLHITGAAYGEAANLISNVAGKMSYGDAGAQIRFTSSSQNGAIIFNHYDNTTPSSTFAASFNFVTDQATGVALKSDGFIINGTTTWLRDNNLTFSQGGGWAMSDSTWIHTVGSKSVYMNAGTFRNDGTTQLRNLQHVNANIVADGSWTTGATGTAGDGTNAGTLGTSILAIGNSIAQSTTSGSGKDNSQGYLRLYNSASGYSELTSYGTWVYPTTGLAIPIDKIGIMFRPSSSSYYTHISYQTGNNEALVAATQNAVTSFIFINGESYANVSSTRWRSLTPALQIKNNSVIIGKLIDTGITPSYKFEVDGTSYFSKSILGTSTPSSWLDGQRYQNGALNIADYSNTGSYNPWMRATNTWSSGPEDAKIGRWFSFGTLGASFYWIGSTTTRTADSYDHAMIYNIANGTLTAETFSGNLSGNAATATTATSANQVLRWSTNETAIGADAIPANATNNSIWFNYRSGYGGTTSDAAAQLKAYYFGDRKGQYNTTTIYAGTFSGALSGNASSASKISAKLATTTKTYLLGTATAITATAANVDITGDTGVYLTTTAGELSAVRHSWNASGTEKAYTVYNTTDDSIDFVFI